MSEEYGHLRGRIAAIALGASAGGVEALSILLPALPADLPGAVFAALHIPRDRPSLLVEIFAPLCALAVREAEDKETVQPATVYFAPPDYHLLIDEGPQLALSVDEAVHFSRPSIDVLFESAAAMYREQLLGIILTGANEDGTEGLAAVKRMGGITVVQEPDSAHSSRMVLSALARLQADYVLPLNRITQLLRSLGRESGTPQRGRD